MQFNKNKVSIIIPTKNEAEGLKKVLRSVKPYSNDIIVVDGHSKDSTKKIVEDFGARFFLDSNIGRGEAIRLGIKKAKNDYLLFFDADGSHNSKEIPLLLNPLFKNKADGVIGSRRTGGSFDLNNDIWGIIRSGGSDFLAYLVNRKFNTNYSDILYSFRSVKKPIAKKLKLKSNGFELEQEFVVKMLKKNYKLLEVPTRENKRAWGQSKLHTITGIKFVFSLLKELYFE